MKAYSNFLFSVNFCMMDNYFVQNLSQYPELWRNFLIFCKFCYLICLFFIKISANDLVTWHKLITNEAKYHPTFPKSVLTILVSPYINSIIDFINIGVHTPCLEPNLCSFTPMPGVRKTNICPKFTENCLSH